MIRATRRALGSRRIEPGSRALRIDASDDPHGAVAAPRAAPRIGCVGARSEEASRGDEGTRGEDVSVAIAVGEKAVVADAGEARGDHVHEEAPEELSRFE